MKVNLIACCTANNQSIIIEYNFERLVGSVDCTTFPYAIDRHDLWCEKSTTAARWCFIIWCINFVVVNAFVPLIRTNKGINTWDCVFFVPFSQKLTLTSYETVCLYPFCFWQNDVMFVFNFDSYGARLKVYIFICALPSGILIQDGNKRRILNSHNYFFYWI